MKKKSTKSKSTAELVADVMEQQENAKPSLELAKKQLRLLTMLANGTFPAPEDLSKKSGPID
jgi:hypothetical protein